MARHGVVIVTAFGTAKLIDIALDLANDGNLLAVEVRHAGIQPFSNIFYLSVERK